MTAIAMSMPTTRTPRRMSIRTGIWPLLFLLTLLVLGVFGAALSRYDPDDVNLAIRLQPPPGFGGDIEHIAGTDSLGRDVFARVLAGTRISLLISVAATILAGTVGTSLGMTSGFLGGRWDVAITWLSDVQMAIPFVVVAIGMAATIEPSASTVVLVLGLTGWSTYARVARLASQPLRQAGFVDSARISGATEARVVGRHVLPVILPVIIAIGCQQAGSMLLYESALSFLGLGVPPGTITWGGMIADARETAQVAWWVTVAPGLAIVLVVVGFNAVGRWLTDRLLGIRVY